MKYFLLLILLTTIAVSQSTIKLTDSIAIKTELIQFQIFSINEQIDRLENQQDRKSEQSRNRPTKKSSKISAPIDSSLYIKRDSLNKELRKLLPVK